MLRRSISCMITSHGISTDKFEVSTKHHFEMRTWPSDFKSIALEVRHRLVEILFTTSEIGPGVQSDLVIYSTLAWFPKPSPNGIRDIPAAYHGRLCADLDNFWLCAACAYTLTMTSTIGIPIKLLNEAQVIQLLFPKAFQALKLTFNASRTMSLLSKSPQARSTEESS